MVLRQVATALALTVLGLSQAAGAMASDNQLLALNAPLHSPKDPAMTQAVEILSKTPHARSGETKRGTIFNSQPANDTTVVKYRKDNKDLDKVLILGGAEVLPM
jgi:hypothetical protein